MELGTFKRDFKILVSKFSGTTQTLLKNKSYLAGGALRSLFLQEKPKDYGLFFLDATSMDRVVSAAADNGMVVNSSGSAVTLKAAEGEVPFQLIRLDYGSPTDVISRFDFSMNMNFYMPTNDWGLIQHPQDIRDRELIFNPKASTPLSALIRVGRFQSKGWGITPVQIARIGVAISKLNPITTGEQMKSLGMSEYSGPNVHNLDIGQVLSQELHPLLTLKKFGSNDPLGYRNFTTSVDMVGSSSGPVMAGVIQNIQRLNEAETVLRRRGDGRRGVEVRPEDRLSFDDGHVVTADVGEARSPEVASQPVEPAAQINETTNRWWDMTNGREVAAAPMTAQRLRNAVEQMQNAPMMSDETPF